MPQNKKKSQTVNHEGKQPVIMQVIPELGPGGAEQGCLDVAKGIVEAGGKAIVLSHGGSRVHELTRCNATHINLPVHSKNPFVMWRNIGRIKRLVKKYNVDVVHVRSRAPAWSAYYACKKIQAHFMTTCHASYNVHNEWKRKYNSVMARGERVIAVSNHVANYVFEHYEMDKRNMRVIHRGVDLTKYNVNAITPAQIIKITSEWRLPEDARIVMMPGRITRLKGHHVLIDAMAKLKEKNLYCVLIGSDQGRHDYRAELDAAIEGYNLGTHVRIVDHCSELQAAYILSDVIVSASTEPEGFGRIPIEAQIMGKPIIATDHGGVQETIIHGQTGWLIPPNDSDALAETIKNVLSLNEEEKAILANNAMNHVAHNFSNEKMVDETLNVYAELLKTS